jgi:capsule polysaccharide export protein KpsE/RkpR
VNPQNPSRTTVVERPSELEAALRAAAETDTNGVSQDKASDWLWLLWGQRRFLWRVTIRGLVLALIVAFLIPKRYESFTRLMPPDQQSGSTIAMLANLAGKGTGLGNSAGALGSIAGDMLGLKTSGALFVDLLRSRTVQDHLIDRFNLRKVYGCRYYQDARKILTKFTDVSEDRKSGVISIVVTDRDPRRAQQMSKAYVEELDNLVALVSTSSARRERIFIEQRLTAVKRDLDAASKQFSEYASQNTVIDISAQTKAMVEGAARLQGELIVAQSELEGLEQIYTGNNVRVRSLRARVAELRSQLAKIGGDSSHLDAAPDASSGELYPSIRQMPLLGVKWIDLYRNTKTQETVYDLLTQQYEMAKIQEAKEIPTVKVLDAANLPEKKAFPPRLLIGMLGMLMSFVVAGLWVIGRTKWEGIDPLDPQKILAQEVCGTLKSRAQQLWRDRRQLPRKLVTPAFAWLRVSRSKRAADPE